MSWTAPPAPADDGVSGALPQIRQMSRGPPMSEPTVHTYRAAEAGLWVNSYLVETATGVLVFDTSLLVSDIEALRARLAALKKPLLGIFVTHPHPDHFNGVSALVRDREVPVYAAASVGAVIEEIADAKRAQWAPVYGTEWPEETYHPNTALQDRQQVVLDEVTVSVREVGPAESHADSYFLVSSGGGRPVAFAGDLAFHGMHPYTADGHSAAWLKVLDLVADDLAEVTTLFRSCPPGRVRRAAPLPAALPRAGAPSGGRPAAAVHGGQGRAGSRPAGVSARCATDLDDRPWCRRRRRGADGDSGHGGGLTGWTCSWTACAPWSPAPAPASANRSPVGLPRREPRWWCTVGGPRPSRQLWKPSNQAEARRPARSRTWPTRVTAPGSSPTRWRTAARLASW